MFAELSTFAWVMIGLAAWGVVLFGSMSVLARFEERQDNEKPDDHSN